MSRRRILVTVALAGALVAAVLLVRHPRTQSSTAPTQPPLNPLPASAQHTNQDAPLTNAPAFSQRLLREVPSALQRFIQLERMGQVPENADLWDWVIAQKTSWWGKRLEPKAFWHGRVVWLDTTTTQAAQKHGRKYPPIPYEDPTFASRSDVDVSTLPAADSPDVLYRLSDRENAFWDRFVKTHSQPPEYITGYQAEIAREILGSRYDFQEGRYPALISNADLERSDRTTRRRAQSLGYPPEAFTDEALRWSYVLQTRALYEQQYVQTHTENTLAASNFLAHVWMDPKLITEPLADAQLRAADAWKVSYLQRLRKQNTDESYINAYLQAWNLSAAEVFGGTNGP